VSLSDGPALMTVTEAASLRPLARPVDSASAGEALSKVARQHGGHLAEEIRRRTSQGAPIDVLVEVLGEGGFHPLLGDDEGMILRNCPFAVLAEEHPELICGMNLELLRGLLAKLPEMSLEAILDPGPNDRCCIVLRQEKAADEEDVPASCEPGRHR
jgi:predicted ArsR family transcriptional regulator